MGRWSEQTAQKGKEVLSFGLCSPHRDQFRRMRLASLKALVCLSEKLYWEGDLIGAGVRTYEKNGLNLVG